MPADPLFLRLTRALAGRYTLQRELGQGGMGAVYLGTDVKLGRQVAIKVLPPSTRAHLGSGRFQREVLLAAQLSHPHIVPLFEADEVDGILFYVMGYVEGESLAARIRRAGPLGVDEAVRIVAEVGDALQYAHDSGIIHRDVKPANILLSRGHAMVTDFGIAKITEEYAPERASLTGSGMAVGTAEYMSPEQASGTARIDARSDVYALAAVLYEMLAGEPPFTGPSAQAVVARVLKEPPRPIRTLRPNLPPRVEHAVLSGLAKSPADRPASARALVDLLTRASGDRRRARARRIGWTALGTALAAGAVLWVVRAWERRGTAPAGPQRPAVGVLYFENRSPDTADTYLADGLTESIITSLGRVERLAVKSRNAVRRYRGAVAQDPAVLGRALGVAYLVSGSVQRTGNRLDVTAELLRAGNGVHVWGAQYRRSDATLQAIEQEIADTVATRITGELAPAERTALAGGRAADPTAYDHLLHGNYYLAERTPHAVRRAIAEFEAAEQRDPSFAPALARVALGYALFLDWGWDYPGVPSDEVLARGFAAADRALAVDSASADAWMARGFLLSFHSPRAFTGVEEAFRRATALDPTNAEAYHQYGMALLWLGRDSAAIAMYRRALALEPERAITLFNVARVRMHHRLYGEARRWLDSALAVDPGADYAYVLRALAHLRAGQLAESRADGETAERLHAGYRLPATAGLVLTDLAAGDTAAARARLQGLERELRGTDHPTVTDAAWLGRALVAHGDTARALDLLERARPRGARLWFYLRSPEFDGVREHPRFRRLVEESQPE
jgi:eukaryotic-like serine/threonine-protein kinase